MAKKDSEGRRFFEAVWDEWPSAKNQDDFYRDCKKRETDEGNQNLGFRSASSEPRKDLRNLLNRWNSLPKHVLTIFAQEMGLPADFFTREFPNVEAGVTAARAAWETGPHDATDGPPAEFQSRSPVGAEEAVLLPWEGFGRIGHDAILPEVREPLMAQLRRASDASLSGHRVLTILEGGAGAGKSFLLSRWFWEDLSGHFLPATVLDCSRLDLAQVLEDARATFAPEAVAPYPRGRRLLVLDNLRLERGGGENMFAAIAFARPVRVRRLVEELNALFAEIRGLFVVISVENNGKPLAQADVLDRLDKSAQFHVVRVGFLEPADGATFLRSKGVDWLAAGELEALSGTLQGMPSALEVAADLLIYARPDEREANMADLMALRLTPGNAFSDFFRQWVTRRQADFETLVARGLQSPTSAGPVAVMRFLAIMDGPVSELEVRQLLSGTKVRRLRDVDMVLKEISESPFVRRDGNRSELHPIARLHLRHELNGFIERDDFDAYTNRAELEQLHWRAALLRRRYLHHEEHAEPQILTALHSFVFHVIEQIRLIPFGPAGSNRRPKRMAGGVGPVETGNFERGPGLLSDGQLWALAYAEVRRLILDNRNVATRIFGRFEDKARILGPLAAAARSAKIAVPAALAELNKESAICLMHAGRLRLAQRELSATIPVSAEAAGPGGNEAIWLLECNRACVDAAVRLRIGEVVEDVEIALHPFLHEARDIAADVPEVRATEDVITAKERAALRVLARAADVAFQSGDLRKADELFRLALRLHRGRRRSEVDGECARRYAQFLVRRSPGDPVALAEACAVIDANLDHYASRTLDGVRQGSNDIVPFKVLQAALRRVGGDVDGARAAIEALRDDPFVRNRECTYVARVELKLEDLRQGIWALVGGPGEGEVRAELLRKARNLFDELLNRHHLALSHEAKLLEIELLPVGAAGQGLDFVETMLKGGGLRLRLADCRVLRSGGSALRTFGL